MKTTLLHWVGLKLIGGGLLLLLATAGHSPAASLDRAAWTVYMVDSRPLPPSGLRVTVPQGQPATNYVPSPDPSLGLGNVVDNNPETLVTLTNPASLLIDLGQTCAVHRVFLCGAGQTFKLWPNYYQDREKSPLGLVIIYVGNTAVTTNQVAEFTIPYDAGNPVDTEVDVRFSPATGRYARIELQTNVTWGLQHWPGYQLTYQPQPVPTSWNVAELEIYGCSQTNATTRENAVVLPAGAADALLLAATELSYYLGELSGKPHPIIAPNQTNLYSGDLYRIVDLKSLAPDYSTMTNNIAAGLLPDGVNVERQGREVVFKAWPYRCVLWSVWEFLERQGVRWPYPEGKGDYVPTGRGVTLDMLPLRFTPSAKSIYANWETAVLQPWPGSMKQSVRQSSLYPWRNRWTISCNGYGRLGGAEIPALPRPAITLNSDYTEKFEGYPHNFNGVIPARILQQHTNWWGYSPSAGVRISPYTNGATAFCMNNPEVISWVADKMVAVHQAYPPASVSPLNPGHFKRAYNLLPIDDATYCECPEWCLPANGPWDSRVGAWAKHYDHVFSGMYFNFVVQVAQGVRQRGSDAVVGALAYADVFQPPLGMTNLPDNVQVEVCLYGYPNLRMSSPWNSGLKQAWDTWRTVCSRLATYDYALLHTDYWQQDPRLPAPLVTGTIDRAKYLAGLGALDGGSQGTPESLPYNPWNFYAYPRIRWNVGQSADQVLQEFFTGFYGEAAAPMLAYYKAMEDHQVTNEVSLHYLGYCYMITPGSFPRPILASMKTSLEAAELLATDWTVRRRVAKAREGFDWVISKLGLAGVDLKDVSPFTVVPASGPFVVPLSTMTAPKDRPGGNCAYWASRGEWEFLAAGTVTETFNVAQGGSYQVVVSARAVPYQNIYPILDVYLGGANGRATIVSTNYTDHVFTLNVPAGAYDLALDYRNVAVGGRRNIYVNRITITKQ